MSGYSDANIAQAIKRVPSNSSDELKRLLETAKARDISSLQEAIENELELRGPASFDKASAAQHAKWADQVADANLEQAIIVAFEQVPINEHERPILRLIAENPGIGHDELTRHRGKRDVSLLLGHIVYDRLGFFRKFWDGTEPMSNLLLDRDRSSGAVAYQLTATARSALEALGEL